MSADKSHPVHALPVTHAPLTSYLTKTRSITEFEQEGVCAVCSTPLPHDGGLYSICPHATCSSVTHLRCLGEHLISQEAGEGEGEEGVLVPIQGSCPSCKGEVRWDEVVGEVTLRVRGAKEVERLLKRRRAKEVKEKKARGRPRKGSDVLVASEASQVLDTEEEEESELSELDDLDSLDGLDSLDEEGDVDGEEDEESHSDVEMAASPIQHKGKGRAEVVIEDSDQDSWADALELD